MLITLILTSSVHVVYFQQLIFTCKSLTTLTLQVKHHCSVPHLCSPVFSPVLYHSHLCLKLTTNSVLLSTQSSLNSRCLACDGASESCLWGDPGLDIHTNTLAHKKKKKKITHTYTHPRTYIHTYTKAPFLH